ncbi:LacI family DNA-binding transcriptional regulator [Microbacterium sulfonylureivorans]|uniref:LacI family DNA-binding transcriptional regulator n=1 Tax=Microbacterium sulfonylureivorans TaxID=2486854 RepID=UPI000FDA5FB7|nr:LacI family DNA-binding transcriptional regulator [Microbacterium sulfonylureivorans]
MAALAGVSVGAVSRVLSRDPTLRVGDETRRRVEEAAASLNYVPSHAARALRTSRASALALVLPEVTSAVVAELARGVESAAGERSVNLVLARAARLQEDETWLRSVVASGRVDGVILQLPDGVAPERILEMIGEPLPIVLINSADTGPITTVVLDDALSMRPAVAHLHDLGHRSIGFIGGTAGTPTADRRREGFRAAMAERGLDVPGDLLLELGFSGADGRRAAEVLVERGELPTALVVANVDAALGVLAELHKRGFRVPDDVSLVALHDVWYADATWPPITTVKAPLAELGATAVALLLDQGVDGDVVHHVVSEPPFALTIRASTAPPR